LTDAFTIFNDDLSVLFYEQKEVHEVIVKDLKEQFMSTAKSQGFEIDVESFDLSE